MKVNLAYLIWGIGILVAIIFFYNGNQEHYVKQPWKKILDCEKAQKYLSENDKSKQFEVTIKNDEVPGFSAFQYQFGHDFETISIWYSLPRVCDGKPVGEKIVVTDEGEIRSKTTKEIINDEVMILGSALGVFVLYKAFLRH